MERVDWERIERSAQFRALVARRRRFVLPATLFFLVWYLGFIALAGYAQDFMGESIYEGFTVGYAIALSQFVMVGVLGVAYLRYSRNHLDPLREDVRREFEPPVEAESGRRFEREPADAPFEVKP